MAIRRDKAASRCAAVAGAFVARAVVVASSLSLGLASAADAQQELRRGSVWIERDRASGSARARPSVDVRVHGLNRRVRFTVRNRLNDTRLHDTD